MEDELVTMCDFFPVEQIKLAELSVYNWGSFNGLHTAKIDPLGTLITGDNGSGKSTFIDGLMALFLPPAKASFNQAAAQGDRSDRSLLSYMRGSYGSVHDGMSLKIKSKREKSVVSALRAYYRSDDGMEITLAAMFWITQPTNALADVKRIYVVAKRNLVLPEILDAFADGSARVLKQKLRDDPTITCCDESFTDYQALYRKLLHMENKNAPALLSRALGLKKIDDLTKLIRELVLEPSTLKEDARKIVDEFTDLVAIHEQLVDAREQTQHLQKLPQAKAIIDEAEISLRTLISEKQGLSIYLGEIFAKLWLNKIKEIKSKLQSIEQQFENSQIAEKDASELVSRRREEYLKLGGDKIESLKKEAEHTQDRLQMTAEQSSAYQADAKALGLDFQLDENVFLQNQSAAKNNLDNIREETEATQNNFIEVGSQHSHIQMNIRELEAEIEFIKTKPDSNINYKFQQLRDELESFLQLPDESLKYIGELIDVNEDAVEWQGAIERALGGLRTTLLVPYDLYSLVTKWLNKKHTGLHVRVQVAYEKSPENLHCEFKQNGFLQKLRWKEHKYRDWLKHHLNKFDLHCVATTEELDKTPFSMTLQGLIHLEKGRFEKKDQSRVGDRRQWYLGFNNKSRLTLLENDKQKLKEELDTINLRLTKARNELDSIGRKENLWKRLSAYKWKNINAPYWQKKLELLQNELRQLTSEQNNLSSANERLELAIKMLQEIKLNKDNLLLEKGRFENELNTANIQYENSINQASKGISHECRSLLEKRIGMVSIDKLEKMHEVLLYNENQIELLIEKMTSKKHDAEKSAMNIMSLFRGKEKWSVLTVDWPSGLAAIHDFLEHLTHLEEEGLPALVEQFKERLNKHATQSLARIKTKLESEREDIQERIDTINNVLHRTEFRQGTHLKLGIKKERFPHVKDFDMKVKRVLSKVTSDEHESRFALLSNVVEILEKASNSNSAYTLESLRLLDPRYQMTFFAEEIDRKTHEIRDVLESSSGKSGGEKESFAGTIVAASLAYVLTPDGHDKPVYSTVFLDEAFANTAETVSRRVLKVFKALNIHVNLITPYKNLNLARESARSLLIAERNSETHESHLCEITWEEVDRMRNLVKEESLKTQARTLGVEFSNED